MAHTVTGIERSRPAQPGEDAAHTRARLRRQAQRAAERGQDPRRAAHPDDLADLFTPGELDQLDRTADRARDRRRRREADQERRDAIAAELRAIQAERDAADRAEAERRVDARLTRHDEG